MHDQKQPAEGSAEVQTVASPAVGTSLRYSSADKEDGKRLRTHISLRFWERAGAFLNWTKTSKNTEIGTLQKVSEVSGSHINLREFDRSSIATATNKFSPLQIIYRTGVFTVYKGVLSTGQKVTIKRYSLSFSLGDDLKNEIISSSNILNHRNIMNLLGYCFHEDQAILVSDYASEDNLFNHLHYPGNSPLTWKHRLQICIDAAKGLDYLHTGCKHPIIHRDVMSSNILLDGKWVSKLLDFSPSRVKTEFYMSLGAPRADSFGYLAPECFPNGQLTEKSDVYSFGVVLFEVLCAMQPIMDSKVLATRAPLCFKKGTLDEIIDYTIKGQIDPDCLTTFSETANACLSRKATDRPAMREVVQTLQFAMQCQLVAEEWQLQELAARDADGDK